MINCVFLQPQKSMTLIKSISGIRGTIGGPAGNGLTPLDTVKFASAYGTWVKQNSKKSKALHLVFLLPTSFNVLSDFFPAQTHATATILLNLAYGSPQLRGVSLESLHLQFTHDRSL